MRLRKARITSPLSKVHTWLYLLNGSRCMQAHTPQIIELSIKWVGHAEFSSWICPKLSMKTQKQAQRHGYLKHKSNHKLSAILWSPYYKWWLNLQLLNMIRNLTKELEQVRRVLTVLRIIPRFTWSGPVLGGSGTSKAAGLRTVLKDTEPQF